jgi:hypothetical protein
MSRLCSNKLTLLTPLKQSRELQGVWQLAATTFQTWDPLDRQSWWIHGSVHYREYSLRVLQGGCLRRSVVGWRAQCSSSSCHCELLRYDQVLSNTRSRIMDHISKTCLALGLGSCRRRAQVFSRAFALFLRLRTWLETVSEWENLPIMRHGPDKELLGGRWSHTWMEWVTTKEFDLLFERRRPWAEGILLSRNTRNKVHQFPLSERTWAQALQAISFGMAGLC